MVEVYHRDGKDAGAWVGVEVVNSCLMGCGWRMGGYLCGKQKKRKPSVVLISPPFFFYRGHLALITHRSSILHSSSLPTLTSQNPWEKK